MKEANQWALEEYKQVKKVHSNLNSNHPIDQDLYSMPQNPINVSQ